MAQRQQEALGVLGVNLLHAAFYDAGSRWALLGNLLDGLSLEQIEIDVIELLGPMFTGENDAPAVAADLVSLGLARAVVIDESGKLDQPSTVLRKHPVVVHRAAVEWDEDAVTRVLRSAADRLAREQGSDARPPLILVEASLHRPPDTDLPPAGAPDATAARRVSAICRPGRATMVTSFEQACRVTAFIRRSASGPLRLLIGLDGAVSALWAGCYRGADGGMLEALGRLLTPQTRIEVFGMPRQAFTRRLAVLGIAPEFCTFSNKTALSLADVQLASPAGRFLEYLMEAG
jgi:hypothetical protein